MNSSFLLSSMNKHPGRACIRHCGSEGGLFRLIFIISSFITLCRRGEDASKHTCSSEICALLKVTTNNTETIWFYSDTYVTSIQTTARTESLLAHLHIALSQMFCTLTVEHIGCFPNLLLHVNVVRSRHCILLLHVVSSMTVILSLFVVRYPVFQFQKVQLVYFLTSL